MKEIFMKWFKTLILCSAFTLGGTLFADQAPDFTLTDTNGNEHSLSDFAGKTVVLEWFNSGCPFVKKHYVQGNMQNLQSQYTDKGVVWLSIVSSAPGKQGHAAPSEHNAKMEEWKMQSTALLIDEDGTVGKAYDAKNTPHMFVINPEGEIVYNGAIDSIRSFNPADIPSATNYVKAALDAVLADEAVAVARTQPYGCSVKY
jgi:peroxiredoxin